MPIRRSHAIAGVVVASLAVTLTACSGEGATSATPSATLTPTATASGTPTPVPVSDSIDGISVDGAWGEAPVVSVDTPFAVDKTQTRVVIEGDSKAPRVPEGGYAELQYVGINARTGETFDSSWTRGSAAVMSMQQVVAGFATGVTGRHPGDRVLIVMPGSDAYDSAGGQAEAGIEVGDTLIFVVDVIAVAVEEATGTAKNPTLPVTLGKDGDGNPTLSIPQGKAAPTKVVVEPVIVGQQRAVEATDTILVKYRSYSWKTGKLIEDNWASADGGPLSSTIDAWQEGLKGQPIGSRLVIVAPDAYPTGNEDPAIEAGDTLVFVIDILFASSAV